MKNLIVMVTMSLLAGCGSLPILGMFSKDTSASADTASGNDAYIEAAELPALDIPEDLSKGRGRSPFDLPVLAEQGNPSFYPNRPPLPDAMYVNDNRDEVRVQKLGSRNWLVIPESPTTAWPKTKQFFADNGITLTLDQPETGRLNTDWLVVEDQSVRDIVRGLVKAARINNDVSEGRDRFLIRVEQGLQPQSTEIHIRHENDASGDAAADAIIDIQQQDSALLAAEQELLQQIGAYVAARVAQTTVSKVALQIGSQPKTALARNAQGNPELSLFLDEARAWATLAQALRNADVEIKEQDRDARRIEAVVPGDLLNEGQSGFFCRITFTCSKAGSSDIALLMSDAVATDNGLAFKISVFEAGRPMRDADRAQEILVLIREFAT